MLTIYITPLSLAGQCADSVKAEEYIENFMSAISYLEPALTRSARVYFDPVIEERCLRNAEPLTQTLNNSIQNKDLARRWFLFSRNRAEPCNEAMHDVKVSRGNFGADGNVTSDDLKSNALWLGFEHPDIPESCELSVQEPNKAYVVKFASGALSTRNHLPRYEPNPKHKPKAYTRDGGHKVSPMPLTDTDAQRLLLTALRGGKNLFAFDGKTEKYYRFVKTHVDQDVYHGFEITRVEVPSTVRALLV